MSCKDKTALVTGACGGLGRAIAEAFLMEGANVVVCDINKDLINDFKEKVSAAYPECTLVLETDITDEAGDEKLFVEGEKMFGNIDFVINSAGIMDKFEPVGDLAKSTWDRVMAVNATAPMMITKLAVNRDIKRIVNIVSIAGVRGLTAGAAYTASKHAMVGLTKNTAAYYGPQGIRCNAIMAGAMKTNISAHFAQGFSMEGVMAMRRGYPEESMPYVETEKVAKLVLYLCSDDASIVNGACWPADGGAIAY